MVSRAVRLKLTAGLLVCMMQLLRAEAVFVVFVSLPLTLFECLSQERCQFKGVEESKTQAVCYALDAMLNISCF